MDFIAAHPAPAERRSVFGAIVENVPGYANTRRQHDEIVALGGTSWPRRA